MKTFAVLLIGLCASLSVRAQLTFGIKAGLSPEVDPRTAHCFINRDVPTDEFLLNIESVRYTPTFGAFVRLDNQPYWFMAEVLTYGWEDTYSIFYTYETGSEGNRNLTDGKRVIEVPVSIGVTLGKVEIFSGFAPARVVSEDTQLTEIPGYVSTESKLQVGWHTGIGLNFGSILVDLRYAHTFANYGEHKSVNGWDLTLKNARTRFLMSTAFRF